MSNNQRKLNLNIDEIDKILNSYYRDKVSSTQISKIMKISSAKVKNVITNYSTAYLNKFPQFKPMEDISINTYETHILSSTYEPSKIDIPAPTKKERKKKEVVSSLIEAPR